MVKDALALPYRLAEPAGGDPRHLLERFAARGVYGLTGDDGLPAGSQHGGAIRPQQQDGVVAQVLQHRGIQQSRHQGAIGGGGERVVTVLQAHPDDPRLRGQVGEIDGQGLRVLAQHVVDQVTLVLLTQNLQ